jgi:hypothetical protein
MANARLGSATKASKDLIDEFFGCEFIWLLSCLYVRQCDTPRNNPDFIGFLRETRGA